MAFAPLQWVEKHPIPSAGIALVIVIGVFYLMSGSGSQAASSTSSDPAAGLVDAELQASAQTQQIQGQITAQANNNQTQLDITNSNNAAATTQTTIGAQVAESGQAYQYQTAEAQITGQSYVANLSAQVAELGTVTAAQVAEDTTAAQEAIQNIITNGEVTTNQSNNAATVGIAQIVAQTQQMIGAQQSQVAIQQGADQTQVAVTQANDQLAGTESLGGDTVKIATAQATASEVGGFFGALGKIL